MNINKYYCDFLYADMMYRYVELDEPLVNYKSKNYIEEFLLAHSNGIPETENMDWLVHRITKKGIQHAENIREIWNMRLRNNLEFGHVPVFNNNGQFTFGYISTKISSARMGLLRKIGTDAEVAAMLVRYESLFATTQHWNVPTIVYMRLVSKYKIDLEGFSSPINSQLLKLQFPFTYVTADDQILSSPALLKNPQFCSIFADTDAPFGSIGSFFNANLIGRRATCFIPYVKDLMWPIVNKIINTMEDSDKQKKESLIIYGGPLWTWEEWYQKLTNYKYVRVKQIFKPGTYWFENVDEKKPVNFGAIYLVISNIKNIPLCGLEYSA